MSQLSQLYNIWTSFLNNWPPWFWQFSPHKSQTSPAVICWCVFDHANWKPMYSFIFCNLVNKISPTNNYLVTISMKKFSNNWPPLYTCNISKDTFITQWQGSALIVLECTNFCSCTKKWCNSSCPCSSWTLPYNFHNMLVLLEN